MIQTNKQKDKNTENLDKNIPSIGIKKIGYKTNITEIENTKDI